MQAKEMTIRYLESFFIDKMFKLKKGNSSSFQFEKKDLIGFDMMAMGFLESFPGSKIEYSVIKRINKIETIKDEIFKVLEPSKKIDKRSLSIAFSQATINGKFTNNFMPEMLNEADVAASCEIIKNFMTETGFPMLERFNDIKEIDKEINGEYFWVTDWQMPFNLGGDFPIKRIIIAKLANNLRIEEIINFHLIQFDKDIASGEYVEIHLEGKRQFEYTVEYLRKL